MNKYNFDIIVDRKNTGSVKWQTKVNELPMWVADMDFSVLPEIKEAIINKVEVDAYGYTLLDEGLFPAYSKWWKDRYNTYLDPDWMCFSTGVLASLDVSLKRITKKGEKILMLTPIYKTFYSCLKSCGLEVEECCYNYSNFQYKINWELLELQLNNPQVAGFLLCNPHNPIGKIFSKEELSKIIDLCKKYDKYLLCDEIHGDIALDGKKYVPILSLNDYYEKLIVFLSPTKIFNLAGIQTSVAVIPNKELKKIVQNALWADDVGEPNYIACPATIAAYTYGEKWVNELNVYLSENRRYVEDYLKENIESIHLINGDATYLLWIDISELNISSKDFCEGLRKETGLIIDPGSIYGKGGEGFIRINIATNKANVMDAMERLNRYVDSIKR